MTKLLRDRVARLGLASLPAYAGIIYLCFDSSPEGLIWAMLGGLITAGLFFCIGPETSGSDIDKRASEKKTNGVL